MTRKFRRWPALAACVGLVLASAALAGGPAAASPKASGARTVAAVKPWVVSNPAASARAMRSKDWVRTPEGLVYKSCSYLVPAGALVKAQAGGTGEIVKRSGAIVRIPRCGHPTLAYPRSSLTDAAKTMPSKVTPETASCAPQSPVNPHWWVESCWRDSTWLDYLNEEFSVPNDPADDGALFFEFPGLADTGQDSILQPILNWGVNPTIVTNPNIWYIMSEYAWSGTFVHSAPMHISTPNTVIGSVTALGCNASGEGCTWDVTTSAGSASTSISVWTSPAFNVVYGGVLEVHNAAGCDKLPSDGHEAFRNLIVADSNGVATPSLTPYTVNSECSDHATASSTSTDLFWTS